jgi:hypothetical protein
MVERNHKAGQNPPRVVASPEEEEEEEEEEEAEEEEDPSNQAALDRTATRIGSCLINSL